MTTLTKISLRPVHYSKLLALVAWMDSTPAWIDLGEGVIQQWHNLVAQVVGSGLPAGLSCSTVESAGRGLVAVIEDEDGNETRVPIVPA